MQIAPGDSVVGFGPARAEVLISSGRRNQGRIQERCSSMTLLRKFGMGDHPVIATLPGKWMGKQDTGVGFLPQPRYVFLMIEATDVDRTKKVERP